MPRPRSWSGTAALAVLLVNRNPANAKPLAWRPGLDDWMTLPPATRAALVEAAGGDVPAWATAIPFTGNYTASFQVYSPEAGPGCRLAAFLFGPRCGYCRDDCTQLQHQLGSRLVGKHQAARVVALRPMWDHRTPPLPGTHHGARRG